MQEVLQDINEQPKDNLESRKSDNVYIEHNDRFLIYVIYNLFNIFVGTLCNSYASVFENISRVGLLDILCYSSDCPDCIFAVSHW